MEYIVVTPKEAYGPFDDFSDALAFAEDQADWQILTLVAPEEADHA